MTPDGAQGEHASLPLVCNGNPRKIHLQLHTLPLLPLLTQQLLFLPEGQFGGLYLPGFENCSIVSSFPPSIPHTHKLWGDRGTRPQTLPCSPHLFNSATSWAFISARVRFNCSSSSSSLESCLGVPAVESSSSPSSSSPELRLTKQTKELDYFLDTHPQAPNTQSTPVL